MKKFLALFIIGCMLMTTLASCDLFSGKKDTEPSQTTKQECPGHMDNNGDYICDNCGKEFPRPEPPVCDEHIDENGDEKCDVCGADVPAPQPPVCEEHKDEDGDEKCDVCGEKVEKPACTEHADNDGDLKCDACDKILFEEVKYALNISDLTAGVRSEDDINGKFTIVSGTEVRNRTKTYNGIEYNKSIKIGGNAHKVVVSVPGTGTLRFIIQNGSSGVDMQFTKVIAPDGTVHDIEFVAGAESNPLVMIEVPVTEGEWTISRGKNGGTQDIFYLELECVVAVAEESGFELVSDGKTEFLVGEALDTTGVRLNALFANGKTDNLLLENVSIDTSLVNMGQSGTYPVTITYKDYEPITYNIDVYAPEAIELGFDAVEKLSSNTAAGNGVYYNHSFKEVYMVGEEFDARGLSVIVIARCGEKTLEFLVDDYTVSGFDSSYADFNNLTISAFGLEANVEVHVTDAEPTANADGVYQLLVDPNYLGLAGVLSGPYHVFRTIQGALDYAAHIDASAVKEISIAPGLYKEKLEITIPNLKLIGFGEKPEDVVIEWDSLYGLVDAGGFVHTTDSTATVAIRESAVNCVIDNLTISNYWNSQERMDAASLAIERGLALLVQADRFVMTNSRLLGIQDTLELFTGRQYFENVFISGYTDFVFGTNNTTYFKNCTIHVIDTEKDDKGTAGYITAFKGSNKGENDAIVYGTIFDGCKFTADEGLTPGCTAIGRPWGAYAAVAVINSELGGHISTAGFTGGKNERYVSMNAKPTDATVQYVEYNNTGAGALTEAVAGMRMLTAEEAALYADFATIFGTTNGKVTYLDPWDPKSEEVVVDDRTYYYFNGVEGTEGTSYTYNDNIQGATGTFGDITIDATKGKVTARGSDTQINAGAKLIFNVEAGTLVTVISYPGYGYYTINGVAHNANDTFSMYFAEATEVVIEATASAYLYQIIINPNEEAPEEPTINQIKVSGATVDYKVGDELSLEGLVVKAYYSDYSIVTVVDYVVDASAVDMAVAGSYPITITYAGQTVTLTVNVAAPEEGPEITDQTVLDFSTPEGLEAAQNNPKVTMDGSIRHNGGEIQIQGTISFYVKAGTVIYVTPYGNSNYVSYTVGDGTEGEELDVYNEEMAFMFDEDSLFVYTGLANNYLVSIEIIPPVKEGTYVFGGLQKDGDVVGILESTNNITLVGTWKTHSGGAQIGEDSIMVFSIDPYTTIVIKGYDTNYGKLDVYADDVQIDMDENACYVFTSGAKAAYIMVGASNQGTDEAPDWSKSYISYMTIESLDFVEESTTITFGSEGNYKEMLDASTASIRDNGGNNSQVSAGSLSFAVRAGAKVTINGYPGYTSYTFGDGTTTSEEITDQLYEYVAERDCIITITPVNGNNYFYSFDIAY